MRQISIVLLLSIATFFSCQNKKQADLIVFNAKVYTVDDKFSTAEAFAVKAGRVVAVGKTIDITAEYDATNKLDAEGKPLYPGFIDAHAHFYNYGANLQTADLVGTKSWEEILEKLVAFSSKNAQNVIARNEATEGGKTINQDWLIGRGWDQNDWTLKEYPTKKRLDELFPNRPVFLTRVDGHAAIANEVALKLAGLKPNQTLIGGEIETKNGVLTGVLVDNATDLVSTKIPEPDEAKTKRLLLDAQANCFAAGLTTIVDCGLNFRAVDFIDKMNKANELKMRLFVMLSDDSSNYAYLFKKGKIKTDRLNVRSFKLYADGALGSRGACLLHAYNDRPKHTGFMLNTIAHYEKVLREIEANGFQACTHAIGDSANREILRIYGDILKGKNDKRWRIEHAQVVNQADFDLFGRSNITPSVQPTHATSDMYWAGQRLGKEREKGAYAFKQLLNQNGWIPLGTDFPVEDISPMKTFYASVVRKDAKGFPEGGYQFENALSREETLRGMTIWAAKGSFEEGEKGSIEVGKFADFIILNQDIMTVAGEKLLETKVLKTVVGGEVVFDKK
jgi:predicted amidohydrolase YtcJ